MSLAVRSVNALAASTWRTSTFVGAAVTSAAHTHFSHFAGASAFNYATPANKAKYVKSGSWSAIG
ncbi:MAG: hypothetical protein F2519_00855 [Actinobacteria bacterium]|uniref:Unannotated protein n=1 Tax=freshwater metagenome TaxID=449393 RepID=A0A6J6ATG4_9ZZZZ|nr:hypothetical protein [Actinomycetota bacterium]MSY82005.1 hypothetical protein [Actinomycetota bacterium]MSZ46007.1 hypothetical protein [Actinomycetota bacterium]MTA04113.1 hypothetical protein [Actinomycetota bacterium]MTA22278.1 hypothetical protein [Actinomycetota bacterium]